jgi:hypothetical protein
VKALGSRNDLLLTMSFANNLARLASSLGDPEICDEQMLLELLALADRAEEAVRRLDDGGRASSSA